jgi:hypothetical protein
VLEAAAISAGIKAAMAGVGWLRAIAPTPGSERKYQQTHNRLDLVFKQWKYVADRKKQAAKGSAGAA